MSRATSTSHVFICVLVLCQHTELETNCQNMWLPPLVLDPRPSSGQMSRCGMIFCRAPAPITRNGMDPPWSARGREKERHYSIMSHTGARRQRGRSRSRSRNRNRSRERKGDVGERGERGRISYSVRSRVSKFTSCFELTALGSSTGLILYSTLQISLTDLCFFHVECERAHFPNTAQPHLKANPSKITPSLIPCRRAHNQIRGIHQIML